MIRLATRGSCLLCLLCALGCTGMVVPPAAAAGRLRIVAAENFYGDIASQLAGPSARVSSVLSNPDANPHLFEVDVATARAVADADLVIYNGLHYDAWMTRLLASTRSPRRLVVEAAKVVHAPPDANPHLWYHPAAMRAVARAITQRLSELDRAHRAEYAKRLARFVQSMSVLDTRIERMRARYAGAPVAATAPVADDLLTALGLKIRERRFALAVMNNTEPSARESAAFEEDLRNHSVRVLVYNRQATGPVVERLMKIARQAGIPVVGVTETEPAGLSYQHWMLDELGALERALAGTRS